MAASLAEDPGYQAECSTVEHQEACNTHTHTFNGPFSRTTRVSWYQKGEPIWILLKQETVSGSGISWAICKSAPCSRQTTTPAPHHSVYYRPDALPAAQPTASKQSTEGNKTKQQQTEYQWIRHAFLSQSTFGSDISNDMLPPTLRNKGCRVLLIVSASVTARWSIHIITLHRSSPTKVENFTDI